MLNDMIKYMDLAKNYPQRESPKYLSYMGHDSTIAAMQVILHQLFNVTYKLMNFGSNQVFFRPLLKLVLMVLFLISLHKILKWL